MDSGLPPSHAFGHWRFDPATGDLFDGDSTTRLEPQVAKLLDYFLTHQDTLLTRDELIGDVWGGRIVSDDAINRCISILRQVLSPDDKNALIETVVRRGFISHFPPPSGVADEQSERDDRAGPAPRKKPWALALLAAVLAVLIWDLFDRFTADPEPDPEIRRSDPPMVAVLPFLTTGLAGDSEFFANGIHDDLLTQLAQVQSLRVISRTSVYTYRNSDLDTREIGRELGADAILEGGVQQVGDQIRLNVQLIDAHSDVHLWAEQYDRELSPANIFAIQAEIAQAIATALQARLTEQDTTQLSILPTHNMAAYRVYHAAMQTRGPVTIDEPAYIAAMEQAVALDPGFVRAWAELAGALCFANFDRPDPGAVRRVEEIIERIQVLAPNSADALFAQAYFAYYLLEDYVLALELATQAQALRPSDAAVVELKSWIQRRVGDFDGRVESVRLARMLDPRNPRWTDDVVSSLILAHRYDEAMREIEQSSFETYQLAYMRTLLLQREARDAGVWLAAMRAIGNEFGAQVNTYELWEAHIAARDYRGAEAALNSIPTDPIFDIWDFTWLSGTEVIRAVTYWLLDTDEGLAAQLLELRTTLERHRTEPGRFFHINQSLVLALIAAAEGNTEEAQRNGRTWLRASTADLAERAIRMAFTCRVLGMAGATADSVGCIRTGLAEPSTVMPFIEPYLPFYDSMRDEPEFIALLADIEGGMGEVEDVAPE